MVKGTSWPSLHITTLLFTPVTGTSFGMKWHSSIMWTSSVCMALGLPLHPAKKAGPTTCMVTLGIKLFSVNQLACLPNDKMDSQLNLLQHWASYPWCTKRHLQSLIGHLQHAGKVVWPGCAYTLHDQSALTFLPK